MNILLSLLYPACPDLCPHENTSDPLVARLAPNQVPSSRAPVLTARQLGEAFRLEHLYTAPKI